MAWHQYAVRGRGAERTGVAMLLVAIWGASAARFLAFPVLADRFFAPAHVCTVVCASALLVRGSVQERSPEA